MINEWDCIDINCNTQFNHKIYTCVCASILFLDAKCYVCVCMPEKYFARIFFFATLVVTTGPSILDFFFKYKILLTSFINVRHFSCNFNFILFFFSFHANKQPENKMKMKQISFQIQMLQLIQSPKSFY